MYPYQNKELELEDRLNDLLARMTLEEKIFQTDQYYSHDFTKQDVKGNVTELSMEALDRLLRGNSAGSIQTRGMDAVQTNRVQRYAIEKTRLGIPFLFSEEALHGLFHSDATCFPQQIGLAATFHPELGRKMGHAIAAEARAVGIHETYSPVMDLSRDPRYGRTEESYGEDVHLSAEFARETVLGLQGSDLSAPDCVAAEPKHYVGYGNPVGGLNCAPSTMGRHDVFAECLPVFEAAFVEGHATDAMCSYNSIDGIPVAMDHELLTEVLRNQYGMPGFVRSDLTAIARLHDNHYVAENRLEAMAMGLEAGVDLQLYDFPHDEWQNGLCELVRSGRLSEAVIDQACRRVLRVKFLLGLFEHPYTDERRKARIQRCPEHLMLARQIALESICLLKNEGNLLPLKKDVKKIAVLGPGAASAILGDYTVESGVSEAVCVLEGIRSKVSEATEIFYEKGCSFLGDTVTPFHPGMLINEEGEAGLTGRYYNGRTFQGEPVCVRTDHMINFNWIYAKPHPELDAAAFSVVWTGSVKMPYDLDGCIGFGSMDSMRLYINGELVIDGFVEKKNSNQMVEFQFKANQTYDVRIEFTNDQRGARVIFGYNNGREDFSHAVLAAAKADVAIVCLGDSTETSGENFDRVSLDLPGQQLEFLKAVYATGTPVVLVLQSGRPVTAVWEQEHIPAILEAWFPGEQGGYAVADVIFGDYAPSGRLPVTFPQHVGQIPCHYSRRPGGGKRYVEMNWLPLYPFGYGLTYTTFAFENLCLSKKEIQPGESVIVTVTVTNTGETKGVAVPQVYLRDVVSSVAKPYDTLAAFTKAELEPGERRKLTMEIGPKAMRTLDPEYHWSVEPGKFQVFLGDNAENIILKDEFTVL